MTPIRRLAWSSLSVLVAAAGCGSTSGSGPDAGGGVDASPGADAPSGARTLANCTTSIAADAPEFYKRYFRCVTVTKTATGVAIQSQDLPPHPSSYYPTDDPNYVPFDSSRGSQYHANPNHIGAQTVTVDVPDDPVWTGITITSDYVDGQAGTNSAEYQLGVIGVALDSVSMYSGVAAPGDVLANEVYTFDDYDAHPDMNDSYHYHGPTPGPLEVLAADGKVTSTVPGAAEVEVYGILCDGTVVLGCTELDGSAPSGALDAQGGHVHDLVDGDGTTLFTNRYHVHVCFDGAHGHTYTPEIHYYDACN